jgi:protein-S-isoprenylcysteine O-methyltransferase Ste14
MKKFDYPPVWLVACLVLVWALGQLFPGLAFSFPGQWVIAVVLLIDGLAAMGLAVFEMTRAKTTVVPRQNPSALVTSGIFRLSRNPIYLGDLLVLAAAVAWWAPILGLPLLYLFPKVIVARFINGEEATLRAQFGDSFAQWSKNTRRWL